MEKTIQVCLGTHFEEFVQTMIKTGEYKDVSDVVCEGLQLLEEQEETFANAEFVLSPKGCLDVALSDAGIVEIDFDENNKDTRKFNSAFLILEKRMKDAGYITDDDGETKEKNGSEEPFDIFHRTIKGFYPEVTDNQVSVVWDLFVNNLERCGHTKSEK